MVLHPQNIHVVRAAYVQWHGSSNGRHRARITPLVNFEVAIGEGKAAGPAMVTGWIINDFGRGKFRIAVHLDDEISVIDAVLAFVEDDIGQRRTGPVESGKLA